MGAKVGRGGFGVVATSLQFAVDKSGGVEASPPPQTLRDFFIIDYICYYLQVISIIGGVGSP